MPPERKKGIFELPLKFIFTEEGSSMLIRQKAKFTRIKMGDNTEEYGILLDKVTPASVQRMLMAGYISKIEVSGIETAANRAGVIDLSKLIIFSLLYGQYHHASLAGILSAEPVKRWNHTNPFSVIDEKTHFKEGSVRQYLKEHETELSEITKELLAPLNDNISRDETFLDDEKQMQTMMAEKLLSFADPLIWFVLIKFKSGPDYFSLLRDVRLCLAGYLKKTRIAEYTALLTIELAQNIENVNILKEARVLYKNKYVKLFKILRESRFRVPVINQLRQKNNLITISWKIGGTSTSIGTRGKLQVVLYDKEINYREMRGSFEATHAADITKNSLTEYYNRLLENGNDLELGMYYLSYLGEACEKVGIKFESMVNQIPLSDVTMITLTFGI
ncbi:MAG: hypothetical protein LBI67_10670 [Treponema sp.]|jgi:hypothetical protein|nr:hypothetical protein [Treponema sp.]